MSPRSVCVFCASNSEDPMLLALAAEVGSAVARRGWTLVSGGGSVSMMGAVATAARLDGGHTVGVIPAGLREREVADLAADELVVVDTMRERKQEMDSRSDAFLALPGGIGTLEELFEAWTAATLGFHTKPVVVCDPVGFYQPLLSWLGELTEVGLVKPHALGTLLVATNVQDALDACEASLE